MSFVPLVPETRCGNNIFCEGGDCIGCRNGTIWCDDPRCNPHCTDCFADRNSNKFVTLIFIAIILCLLLILFIFIVSSGNRVAQKYTVIRSTI